MKTYEQQQIKKLYDLLERSKGDDTAVLTWAIFQLERLYNIKLGDLVDEED